MKRLLKSLVLIIILTSCTESFKTISPAEFNEKISKRTDIKTAEELIEIYYNYPPNEGTPQLELKSKEIEGGLIEVTLIHDRHADDSQRATKIVMTAELNGKSWLVRKVKANWKCYDGRGHTDWGTGPCN